MLRRGKLWKPCRRCEKMFKPTGTADKICDSCKKKSRDLILKNNRKRWGNGV